MHLTLRPKINVYAVIGTRPNFPYTKYDGSESPQNSNKFTNFVCNWTSFHSKQNNKNADVWVGGDARGNQRLVLFCQKHDSLPFKIDELFVSVVQWADQPSSIVASVNYWNVQSWAELSDILQDLKFKCNILNFTFNMNVKVHQCR